VKVIYGDLVQLAADGEFDLIVHGCNCFCTMGAGIAKSIKAEFPEAFHADCMTTKGDVKKLGQFSYAEVRRLDKHVTVVNAYTQYHWRGKGVLVDYDAVRAAFVQIKKAFPGKSIGYPKIGAGLAGGDWAIISDIINKTLLGERHCLVAYDR